MTLGAGDSKVVLEVAKAVSCCGCVPVEPWTGLSASPPRLPYLTALRAAYKA